MLGLGFALRGTLTASRGLERDAFVALVEERAAAVGRTVPPETAAVADRLFPGGGFDDAAPAQVATEVTGLLGDEIAGGVLIARFRQIADRAATRAVDDPAVRRTLERIASLGIPAAVLCNGWTRIAQREAASAGFTGHVIVSEDLGSAKPDPPAFAALADTLSLPAERIWYVGNDPARDIDGAARAGMQAVWLNPAGATYPAELAPPVRTIAQLEDLLEPLCEEYTRSLLSLRHLLRSALEWRPGHFLPPTERW
jgi:HAD superfamily hydrolase (TIGR01509 family)